MKIILISMFAGVLFYANQLYAQVESGPKIEFEKEVHDHGDVSYGVNVICSFKFKNVGDKPLLISNAKVDDAEKTTVWPKEPIVPGGKGEINVVYHAKTPGPFSKNVTITSNAVNEPTKILQIKGLTSPAPEEIKTK